MLLMLFHHHAKKENARFGQLFTSKTLQFSDGFPPPPPLKTNKQTTCFSSAKRDTCFLHKLHMTFPAAVNQELLHCPFLHRLLILIVTLQKCNWNGNKSCSFRAWRKTVASHLATSTAALTVSSPWRNCTWLRMHFCRTFLQKLSLAHAQPT